MIETTPMRPLPAPDALTAPFWSAVRQHRFMLPSCKACGRTHFYPRSLCPHCSSADLEWIEVSGTGTVYSFTLVQRAPSPAFSGQVPYVVAIVELAEGPHLMTGITGCDPKDVAIGMAVEADYLDIADATLPMFRPAGSAR
ncbi:MAG TPA: Zn-ribbon domain-containing OB-fold protein [Stellaceae bacterium]|nr:Zn-ribbon domain-containing OB-fold protein [Stellaceae bacterium]